MSLVSSSLASRLLPLASHGEVVDLLLESADLGYLHQDVSTFKGVWSAAAAGKYFKGPLDKVCAIARHPRTDPQVLERFTKDTRVSVRRALLSNPSTPYEAVISLGPWAIERQDDDAVPAVLSRATAQDVISLLEGMSPEVRGSLSRHRSSWIPAPLVARKALETAETALKAAALSWFPLAESLVRRHQRMAAPPVTITDLVEAMPKEYHPEITVSLLRRCSVLTEEIALLAQATLQRDKHWLHQAEMGENVTLVEPQALPVLATTSPRLLEFALASGLEESDVVGLLPTCSFAQLEVLISSMSAQRGFSAEAERAIAERIIEMGGDLEILRETDRQFLLVGRFLANARHRLPEGLALDLLRRGSTPSTREWVSSPAKRVNAPAPGQLLKLARDPGAATTSLRVSSYGWSTPRQYEAVTEEMGSWLNGLTTLRSFFTWDRCPEHLRQEVVDLTDSMLVQSLTSGSNAPLVMPILEALFGSNRHQWETFLSLADGWTAGFRDLVEATASLTGVSLLEAADPPVPAPAQESRQVELALA